MVSAPSFLRLLNRLALPVAAALTLSACAAKPPASDPEAVRAFEEINDPLEPWNRAMLQLDQGLDTVIFDPSMAVYKIVVPRPGRQGVTNFIRNFRTPVTLVNDIFQGEGQRAGITMGRFVINSTVGLLGLFDVAKHLDIPYHGEDFGQTLAVWGVDEGPYLYVPVLGPSSGRDIIGYALDQLALDPMADDGQGRNPFWWQVTYFYGLSVDGKTRAAPVLDDLEASSIDYYAALRAAYRQNRAQEIRNGAPAPAPLLEDFDDFDDFDFDDFDFDGGGDPFTGLDGATDQPHEEIAAQ